MPPLTLNSPGISTADPCLYPSRNSPDTSVARSTVSQGLPFREERQSLRREAQHGVEELEILMQPLGCLIGGSHDQPGFILGLIRKQGQGEPHCAAMQARQTRSAQSASQGIQDGPQDLVPVGGVNWG